MTEPTTYQFGDAEQADAYSQTDSDTLLLPTDEEQGALEFEALAKGQEFLDG